MNTRMHDTRRKRTSEAAKREIANQKQPRPHHHRRTTPPPPPPPLPTPQHLTANRHRGGGTPLAKKSYGYKFISDEEAAAVAAITKEKEEAKSNVRENSVAVKGPNKHEEAVIPKFNESENEAPPTMEKLAQLPIRDAVRLALRYKLIDHLPELEGSPLAEWGKGGVDADVKAALTYTLYDHPLLGNRDAAASHSVGPTHHPLPQVSLFNSLCILLLSYLLFSHCRTIIPRTTSLSATNCSIRWASGFERRGSRPSILRRRPRPRHGHTATRRHRRTSRGSLTRRGRRPWSTRRPRRQRRRATPLPRHTRHRRHHRHGRRSLPFPPPPTRPPLRQTMWSSIGSPSTHPAPRSFIPTTRTIPKLTTHQTTTIIRDTWLAVTTVTLS